ncbi:MAG: HAD-IC family P-type ATPase, partial [Eubacterium sp.]|nr:HAD-IC family P-type ATPase [Eubacterium sp.]
MEWYSITVNELIRETGINPEQGLDHRKVAQNRKKWGANELLQEKGPGIVSRFFSQFKDFMILTLLAAALISFLASYFQGKADFTDPCIILAIVIINAVIGVFQEQRAEHSLEALRSLQTPETIVIREGKKTTIPSRELVPGDIVCLETGCQIPADARLLTCHNLSTEESALTGETGMVSKTSDALTSHSVPLGDRKNCVFAGTVVTTGRGICYVTDTGMNTQIGQIAGMLAREESPETPLTRRLNKTGKMLGLIALGICIVIFFLGIRKKLPVFSMFMTSVSLGVAAIPESLPALVTIMLSLGVERMAKKKAIIRHLPAVETLGSASVICSDKTGTLTENKMTVRETFPLCDESFFARLFVLCNDNTGPMEKALVQYAASHGINFETEQKITPRIFELPFDSSRKKMTTLHNDGAQFLSVTKGAPEILLANASQYTEGGVLHPMTPAKRKEFQKKAEEYAARALRVLAVSYRISPVAHKNESLEKEFIFAGFVGLMDPPRKEAYAAVVQCKKAGIKPVMITGDHRITAAAIGRELGICSGEEEVMTGQELDLLTDKELSLQLSRHSVFARVTPSHKVRLVKLFQEKGNVVAMTGDGVNDAP